MRKIRAYNDERSKYGGYNDSDLAGVAYGSPAYTETDTVEQVLKKRYTQASSEKCGWHWYSAFLNCLYYGGSACQTVSDTAVRISTKCTIDSYPKNTELNKYFKDYTAISGDSKYDLNQNRVNLIKKQNALDVKAYNNSK